MNDESGATALAHLLRHGLIAPVGQRLDAGGIADIEFLVQYWMLKWADEFPPIILFTDNIRQLESLESGNIVPRSDVDFLTSTYRLYRERMHHLSLAGDEGLIDDAEFMYERGKVVEMWHTVNMHLLMRQIAEGGRPLQKP